MSYGVIRDVQLDLLFFKTRRKIESLMGFLGVGEGVVLPLRGCEYMFMCHVARKRENCSHPQYSRLELIYPRSKRKTMDMHVDPWLRKVACSHCAAHPGN
jgi:hypothetical protein